jgi:hypothetical protein
LPTGPEKDPNDPSTTSFAWDQMISTWTMVETILGGTEEMRRAGQLYLPQHEEESDVGYRERLNTNVLFNMTELTLEGLVGRPFSDPVRMNDDVPEPILDITANIDLQGNDISTFCREWFKEGVSKAFSHVLVDFPALSEGEKEGRTLADDRKEGRRPYWQLIKPENLIFASSNVQTVNGNPREFLTQVRIKEFDVQTVGFAEVVKERIRVLFPGSFVLFEKQQKDKRHKEEWAMIDQGETGLDFIPLVTFYTNRDGLMMGKSPIEDLAHLNIRWWQSNSDQINVLTVSRFPMLAVAGATDVSGSVLRIGPRQLMGTKDPNGRFYFVEHQGKSISAGRQELLDLEEQMASYGAEFLKSKPGSPTATARALDSAESITPLQDMTVRFIDAVNTALDYTASWFKITGEGDTKGGTVSITTDFGPEEIREMDIEFLMNARKVRDISREAFISEAKRRGLISSDYDSIADLEQLFFELEALEPLQPLIPGTFDPQEGGEAPEDASAIIEKARRSKELLEERVKKGKSL